LKGGKKQGEDQNRGRKRAASLKKKEKRNITKLTQNRGGSGKRRG